MLYQIIIKDMYCYRESFEEAQEEAKAWKDRGFTVEIIELVPKKGH